jgi:hypothetical protein
MAPPQPAGLHFLVDIPQRLPQYLVCTWAATQVVAAERKRPQVVQIFKEELPHGDEEKSCEKEEKVIE